MTDTDHEKNNQGIKIMRELIFKKTPDRETVWAQKFVEIWGIDEAQIQCEKLPNSYYDFKSLVKEAIRKARST